MPYLWRCDYWHTIRVASNTIIGGDAVVIKDVDIEGSIVAGVPAKVIEKNMEK